MEFRAGKGAVWILRVALLTVGVMGSTCWWGLSMLWDVWSLWGCFLPFGITAILAVWYLPRLVRSLRGSLDERAIRATYGLVWRREVFVPMDALRTFETWTPPLHRLFSCRTVILRFAGGAAWLPLLDRRDAQELTGRLEQAEESR